SGHSGVIKQWEAATGKGLRSCSAGGIPAMLRYSPDSQQILTFHHSTAYLFEAATGNQLQTFSHPEKPINSLAWSPDGKTLLSATGAYLYDDKGKLVLRGGKYVYTDCKLRQWEAESGRLVSTIGGYAVPVYGTNFTPEGRPA